MSERPIDKPSALELARLAALLDPALAKTNPLEAVRIASKLVAAAQKHIDRAPAFERFARDLKGAMADAEYWVPEANIMSIGDAYERLDRERYKTLSGFVDALRAEKLTRLTLDSEEVTSERAVCELLRRKAEHKRKADRERKKAAQEKRSKNLHRNSEPQKRKRNR
jgi:hypothetical protein